jgi:hypothetical protein
MGRSINLVIMNKFEVSVRLDKAAFLKMQGAELIRIDGEIPNNKFVMLVDREMLNADKQGLVKYSKYMAVRKKLKLKMWKQYHIIKVKKGNWSKQKTRILLNN